MPSPSRPLSPHLSVWRWTLTMVISILHRATGIALYLGSGLLGIWFLAAALGETPLAWVHVFFASWIGQVILFGLTWSLFQHLLGGIRHFVWDTGNGFSPEGREWLARLNIILSVVLTLLAWGVFVWFK